MLRYLKGICTDQEIFRSGLRPRLSSKHSQKPLHFSAVGLSMLSRTIVFTLTNTLFLQIFKDENHANNYHH